MSTNPRDKQFKNSAKQLWDELETAMRQDFNGHIPEGKTWRKKCIPAWQKIIARHDYELAKHTIEHLDPKDLDVLGLEETVQRIPDLTAWTEEQAP